MRKLKLQVQISLNGYIAGPNGEMDWMTWTMEDGFVNYVNELTDSSDTILLGRKLAEGFIPYWGEIAANEEDPQYSFGRKMTDIPKVVFSKTLNESAWKNTRVAKGDLAEEVNKLKRAEGRDIMVYGGAGFVSSLIKEGLIDELHLFVNPATISNGMPIFKEAGSALKLNLAKAEPLACGIVILFYKPA